MGVTEFVLSYKRLKLKLRVFLAGHIVAMVTYCAKYHDVGVNRYRVVVMTHQTLSLEKYWKLFPATLKLLSFMRIKTTKLELEENNMRFNYLEDFSL